MHLGEQAVKLPFVDIQTQEKFLKELCDGLSGHYPELLFTVASGTMNGDSTTAIPVMQISQATLHNHPPYGFFPWVQVSVWYKVYSISVLMRIWKKEIFEGFDDLDAVSNLIDLIFNLNPDIAVLPWLRKHTYIYNTITYTTMNIYHT